MINIVVGILMAVGGFMGYSKKGSIPSLMGGLVIGLAFTYSGYLLMQSTNLISQRRGALVGVVTSGLLMFVGFMRYMAVTKTGKTSLPVLPLVFMLTGLVMAIVNGQKYAAL